MRGDYRLRITDDGLLRRSSNYSVLSSDGVFLDIRVVFPESIISIYPFLIVYPTSSFAARQSNVAQHSETVFRQDVLTIFRAADHSIELFAHVVDLSAEWAFLEVAFPSL